MKRILYTLLGMMLSMGAWAQNVAKIGETEYATLADAFANVTAGQTVKLLSDVKLSAKLEVTCSDVTLDLNGKTISPADDNTIGNFCAVMVHRGAKLTVNDLSAEKTGCIDGGTGTNAFYGGIQLTQSGDNPADAKATLVVNNGTIKGNKAAITGNGKRHNTEITINGGTFSATSEESGEEGCAIYHPQEGTLTINGGSFTGYGSAVEMRSGTLNITGGDFTATATEFSAKPNGNGTTIIGAAIAISQHTTNKDINVNISGGTFNGQKAVYEKDNQDGNSDNIKIAISGGTFNAEVYSENVQNFISGGTFSYTVPEGYCAEGFKPTDDGNGHYGVAEKNYVAEVGNKKYESLSEAIAAAENGETVTLLADVNTEAQIEISGKEITLDLNGKTIEYTGTTTLASGVLLVHNGAGLTINATDGGAINSGEKAYAAVAVTKKNDDASNPAKLVINGGDITGHYYAVVGNGTRHNTEITITGGNLVGSEGTAVYHPQDGILNISGGTFTGKETAVELRAGTLNITDGTFTATATEFAEQGNGSGTTIVGAAIAVSQHTTNKDINVNISGGTFTGIKALYEKDYQDTETDNININIEGGTFKGDVYSQNVDKFISGGAFSEVVPEKYCAEGFSPVTTPNSDGMYEVETTKVASVGANRYTSLQEAVNAAKDIADATVTLLMDITLTDRIDVEGNMTIDLDGKTITTTATCGNGSAFNIKSGNVTIKNGTIDAAFGEANSGETDAITARSGSIVTLEDLDITVKSKNGACAYAFDGGHITIESGTYKNTTTEAYQWNPNFQALVVNQWNTETRLVTVKGGIFYGQDPSDGDDSGKVITFLPETLAIVHNIDGDGAGYYTVVDAVASISVKGYATLDTAIDVSKDVDGEVTVKLLADAETEMETLPENVTINANEKVLTMPTFIVYDGEAIAYPKVTGAETYKVRTATYIRTNVSSTVWGTVCLPFSLTRGNGADYYTYNNISGSTLTVDETTTTVEPNTPVVFKKATGDLNINETNATVSLDKTPTLTAGALVGTYTEQTITEGLPGNIYFINGDKFHQAQVELKVPAYRAYINYTAPAGSAAPRALSIVVGGDDATVIGTLTTGDADVEAIYDVNGRKLSAPQKGINIMKLANGKSVKLIVK